MVLYLVLQRAMSLAAFTPSPCTCIPLLGLLLFLHGLSYLTSAFACDYWNLKSSQQGHPKLNNYVLKA